MDDLQGEAEPAVGKLGMGHAHGAGTQPGREDQPASAQLEEILLAANPQHAVADMERPRHADAIADIFLEPGGSREALARMHDLRETAVPPVEASPDLPADAAVFGHDHHRGDV